MVENTRCKSLMIIFRSIIHLAAHTTQSTAKCCCGKEEARNLSKHDACEERKTTVLKKRNPKQNQLFVTNIKKSLVASAMCSEQLTKSDACCSRREQQDIQEDPC